MTGFGELVAVSAAVAATRSRTEKVRMLADFLRSVPPGAVASALWFLSGRSGRERLGIGPAAVERAWSAAAPAAEATLGLEDVVGALAGLPDLAGEGSAAERARRLGELFGRATAAERSFLARWLVGELRQGAVEAKLDGVRIQVHKSGERIEVYSRRRKPLTGALPEVVESVGRIAVHEVILDGEAIALGADGRPEPFQDTMRRFGRKLDVDEARREIPLSARFFDCLLLGGRPCVARPQRERLHILGELVPPDLRVAALRTADPSA